MQRRDFIKRAGIGAGLVAAPAAVAVQAVKDSRTFEQGQDIARESIEKLQNRLKEAEAKIDQLQSNQKKTIKTAVILTGLVVGLDLSLLI